MIAIGKSLSDAFDESIRLLLGLHRVMSTGGDEGEEGDMIRDAMEGPWYQMSPAEQDQVGGLSADLYTIGEDRVARSCPDEQLLASIRLAEQQGKWPKVLQLLRDHQDAFEPVDIAHARFQAWLGLGQSEAALAFLDEVARLRPLKPDEISCRLAIASSLGRHVECVPQAKAIATNSEIADPCLLQIASIVLSSAAQGLTEKNDATELLKLAIEAGERCLTRFANNENLIESSLILRTAAMHLHLALDFDQLANKDKALDHCNLALRLDPLSENAILVYGYLNLPDSDAHMLSERRSSIRATLSLNQNFIANPTTQFCAA